MLIHKAAKIITFTPVITASSAYSSGKQLGATNLISEAMGQDGGIALLQSVVVIDKAKQKSALNILFFDDVPTLASADTVSYDLTDAQCVLSFIGSVNIPAASYIDSSSNSVVTVTGCGLLLRTKAGRNGVQLPSGASYRDIWAVVVAAGTPTYASTSDLVIKLGFEQY